MGILDGRIGLVVGIANERSYAWHIARSLIARGARCAFTHLPGEKNERRTRRAVDELGVREPWLAPMEATNDADLDAAFARYAESFDRMDFLVHSIAFAEREWLQPGRFVETPRAAYLGAIDVSAYSLLAMARRARPLMTRTGGGSIMAMSYYGSEKVIPGYNVMGVAKAALECTARYLAEDLGPSKIRVNIISGGYLRTLAVSAVGGAEALGEAAVRKAPLRRGVEGSDVGDTAAWLASDLAAGVTGQTIYVDCGISIIGA